MPDRSPSQSTGVLKRHPENPLLTAADMAYPCSLFFNAGVAKFEGRYVIAFRNDYGAADTIECLATATRTIYSHRSRRVATRHSNTSPLFRHHPAILFHFTLSPSSLSSQP